MMRDITESVKVLEFNDHGLTLWGMGDLILRSPGFALVTGKGRKGLVLGEEAQKQSRLHPTGSFNRFWHELSLEPMAGDGPFRHNADLAYAHLQYIAESAGFSGDAIFAVPGNFSRRQLAILQGIAKRTPIRPVALFDSAVAMLIARWVPAHETPGAQQIKPAPVCPVIYADLQLHQVLLSLVEPAGKDGLRLVETVQVPGVGSQDFLELMMRLATDQFVSQSRFNPQHNAESEQHLYNLLSDSLKQPHRNLKLEIRTVDQVHTAELSEQSILQALGAAYRKIDQHIEALVTSAVKDPQQVGLSLSTALAALPSLDRSLSRPYRRRNPEDMPRNCLGLEDHIFSDPEALTMVEAIL